MVTVFFVYGKFGEHIHVTALVNATAKQIEDTVGKIFELTGGNGPVCHTDVPLADQAIDPKTMRFTQLPETYQAVARGETVNVRPE